MCAYIPDQRRSLEKITPFRFYLPVDELSPSLNMFHHASPLSSPPAGHETDMGRRLLPPFLQHPRSNLPVHFAHHLAPYRSMRLYYVRRPYSTSIVVPAPNIHPSEATVPVISRLTQILWSLLHASFSHESDTVSSRHPPTRPYTLQKQLVKELNQTVYGEL